jgi:hypothetical protein
MIFGLLCSFGMANLRIPTLLSYACIVADISEQDRWNIVLIPNVLLVIYSVFGVVLVLCYATVQGIGWC